MTQQPYKKRKLSDPIWDPDECCVCDAAHNWEYCSRRIASLFPRFFPVPGVFTCADRYYFLIHKPIPELTDEEYHVIATVRPEFIADFRIRFPFSWGCPYNGDCWKHPVLGQGLRIWTYHELEQVVATRLKICLYLKHGSWIPQDLYRLVTRYVFGGVWDHCTWERKYVTKRIPIIPYN
jgi:hypothetical protein